MKQKVLIIMPFENIYPPKNGGLQRCFHVFHQLTKYFDVISITHSTKTNILSAIDYYPSIANAAIYTTDNDNKNIMPSLLRRISDAFKYRWIVKKVRKSADGSFMKLYPILKKVLNEHEFDYIILEQINLVLVTAWIRKYSKKARIIFNAYNVESLLAQQSLIESPKQKNDYEVFLNTEKNLYNNVDGVFYCSSIDEDKFAELNNNKIRINYVLPNGVDTTFFNYSLNTKLNEIKNVLFCGSLDYEPNKNGLLWFYSNSWPLVIQQLPGSILYIVGRGNKECYSNLINDPTVNFIGEVEDVRQWYKICNVAIAPLLQGSGTRLKILEAMSLGNPVVSTSIGAAGINCTNETNILLADDHQSFATKIINLSTDPDKISFISKNARALVENHYSWDIIGRSLFHFMNKN